MPKIITIGDSTVCKFNDVSYYYPRFGYGELLRPYLNNIEVLNLALSGRSSKSFLVEPEYQKYLNVVEKGDFVIIGFGHNDEKSDDHARFTSALLDINTEGSFKKSLYDNYIKPALDKGATPIVCTPIPRLDLSLKFTGNSIHINENGDYKKCILDLANEVNITGVNLTDPLVNLSKQLKEKQVLLHAISKGKKKDGVVTYDERSVDKTHLNYLGAKWTAYFLLKALKDKNHPLTKYLNDFKEPNDSDLKVNELYCYKDYVTPNFNTYIPTDNFKTEEPFYGTAFGTLDAMPSEYIAKSDGDDFLVGTKGSFGKFNASFDGFAFAFTKIKKTLNFRLSAHVTFDYVLSVRQTGVGLMLRGDSYLNQEVKNESYSTNFIAAGLITTDASTYVNFSRPSPTEINKEMNVYNDFYNQNDELDIIIDRLGQVVTVKTTYRGKEYVTKYIDFDYLAMDPEYVYVGMFATKQTIARFSNVKLEITGNAKEA